MPKPDKRIKVVLFEPLSRDILSMDGSMVLCRAGTIVTPELVQRLSNWIVEEEPRLPKEERPKKKRAPVKMRSEILKRLEFQEIVSQKTRKKLESGTSDIFNKMQARDTRIDISEMEDAVSNLVEETPDDPDTPLRLFALKEHASYIYQHSIECGIMASFVATALNYPMNEVGDFTMAMMLHDAGMLNVSVDLLNKQSRFTPAEMNQARTHVQTGFDMLKRTPGISPMATMMAMAHHVHADGSGYPAEVDFNELPPLVHLGCLINHFEALTSDRPWRRAYSLYEAMKIILRQRDKYHPGALDNFVRVVGFYPIGTFLALNTGEVGVVVRNNPDNLFLPEIKLVLDPVGKKLSKEIIVNLLNEPVRSIMGVRENI